jgi:hypothetical protein
MAARAGLVLLALIALAAVAQATPYLENGGWMPNCKVRKCWGARCGTLQEV